MLIKTIFGVLFFSLMFIGCGTDSTGGKFTKDVSEETDTEIKEPTVESTIKTGVLLDSSVSGINYKTTSGIDGTTNSIGEYKYNDDDFIEFFVGEISLGKIEAKELITTDDFPYPLQSAQFLQTIDSDNFTENGIKIEGRLHQNVLLKKFIVKDENSSLFAKRLNIKDFDDSEKNSIFIEQVMAISKIPYRKIVSEVTASIHKEKAKRLQNIKNNNLKLYHDITNIEINSTLKIIHKDLKPRLIYTFYKNQYRENIELQAQIEEEKEFSDELATEYKDKYLALTNMIIEILLYTENSTKYVKKEIIDNIKNISNQNNKIVEATRECISTLSLQDNNKTKGAKKITDCIKTDIEESSNQFISSIINNPIKAKENRVAIAYLDLYLSSDAQDKKSLLERFENNSTIDNRLWYATTHAGIYDEDNTPSLYESAKDIINNYIAKMSKLSDTVSEGLPQDSFLNREGVDEIKRVSIYAKPIKLESWKDSTIVWTAIDINNKTGADINITDFEPKIITEDGEEIAIPSSHLYTILEQSYARTNSAVNMLTPIFIEDETILEKENSKLSIEIYYKANDDSFQTNSKIIVDFNLDELRSDNELEQFNKNRISLSKSMGVVEEGEKFYLPTVKLGLNRLSTNSIKWVIRPDDIRILTDEDGQLYVKPSLKAKNSSETKFFEASNKLDQYSTSTTFVLDIIRKKIEIEEEVVEATEEEDEEEIDPNSFPITLEYIEKNPSKKLASKECETKEGRVWKNLKFALKDKISTQENIINSIQGCIDIQKLGEEAKDKYIKDNRSIFR